MFWQVGRGQLRPLALEKHHEAYLQKKTGIPSENEEQLNSLF